MDPAATASALIAARIVQAQLAVAARLLRRSDAADAVIVQQLVAAAHLNGDRITAAVQRGAGELVDFTA